MRRRTVSMGREGIEESLSVLKSGGIIAFPTDTVYGIGCDAYSKRAVERIYSLKGRERKKPLVLFPHEKGSIPRYVLKQTKSRELLYKRFIPGPVTFLMKARVGAPKELVSDSGAIGIRIPGYSPVQELLRRYKRPLATTSANVSGSIPAVTSSKISLDIDVILKDDSVPRGGISTIVDMVPYPFVLQRAGKVTIYQIERYIRHRLRFDPSIKFHVLFVCTGNSCRSPIGEWILRKMVQVKGLGNVSVSSCGIMAQNGYPPTPEAIHAMGELGYEIEDHRSQPITEVLLEHSDVVFCMEERQKDHILSLSPRSESKVFLLSERYGSGEEIDDPIGRGINVYRTTTRIIERYVKDLVKELVIRFSV